MLNAPGIDLSDAVVIDGPVTTKKIEEARTAIKAVKVLKSVRDDATLIAQIQKLAARDGLPYQTFMNMLLRKGVEAMEWNVEQRLTLGQ